MFLGETVQIGKCGHNTLAAAITLAEQFNRPFNSVIEILVHKLLSIDPWRASSEAVKETSGAKIRHYRQYYAILFGSMAEKMMTIRPFFRCVTRADGRIDVQPWKG